MYFRMLNTYNRYSAAIVPPSHNHGVGNGNGCCTAHTATGGDFGSAVVTQVAGIVEQLALAMSVLSWSENYIAPGCYPNILKIQIFNMSLRIKIVHYWKDTTLQRRNSLTRKKI